MFSLKLDWENGQKSSRLAKILAKEIRHA